jgi:2-isopropylmalate synthase
VAVEAGANVLNLPDTVGYCMPDEYARMFAEVQAGVPGMDRVILSSHTHDDLGLAVANALAALNAGVRQIECTINGIGERAGNSSLEEAVMALYVRQDVFGLHTEIHHEELYPASQLLTQLTGVPVQRNKAIVGLNAFAHEAGIHQDGVLKNAITYEIMDPQTVGMPSNSIVLGKHSGRHALLKRYEELGYSLTKPELHQAYALFCQIADRRKQVYDEDLIGILHKGFESIAGAYALKTLQSVTHSQTRSTATVELEKEGKLYRDSATAEGPCDAVFRAVDRITGLIGTLEEFSVHAVGAGRDGVAEVSLVGVFELRQFVGKASGTNVVEAAAQAYLMASNKAVYEMQRVGELKGVSPTQPVAGRVSS